MKTGLIRQEKEGAEDYGDSDVGKLDPMKRGLGGIADWRLPIAERLQGQPTIGNHQSPILTSVLARRIMAAEILMKG
jgi:hypothetical protein